ncbi:MAG TPA: hypothetical protein VGG14_03250 [Candidatus Sulfotelmatobacter sp.]|jgi:hypothetical protein
MPISKLENSKLEVITAVERVSIRRTMPRSNAAPVQFGDLSPSHPSSINFGKNSHIHVELPSIVRMTMRKPRQHKFLDPQQKPGEFTYAEEG